MIRSESLIPGWLRNYRSRWLGGDISAGLVVALMLVPQSMAYAIVSGLPPVTGLYASILPALVYAWFGSSSVQSVGTMAITSVMMGTSLASMQPATDQEAVAIAATVALMAGLILMLASMLRLGSLSLLISRPVLSGFTTGSSVMIALSQLQYLLGPEASDWTLLGMPWPQINTHSMLIGFGSLALLWLARLYAARLLLASGLGMRASDILVKLIPFAVIVLATITVAASGFDDVRLVGDVPAGLPRLALPQLQAWDALLTTALSMALMVFLFGQSSSLAFSRKRGERIHADRELFALGASNLAAACSGAFPVTGSISRSAVNFQAGANSQLATVISVLVLAIALGSSTHWLSLLPMPALAAMIILAVLSMMEWEMLIACWRIDRRDALACTATIFGVIFLGFNVGIVLGLLVSLGWVLASTGISGIWQTIRRPMPVMLESKAQGDSRPELHLRLRGAMLFVHSPVWSEAIEKALRTEIARIEDLSKSLERDLKHIDLIIDLSELSDLDVTSIEVLGELNQSLKSQGFVMRWIAPPPDLDLRLRAQKKFLEAIEDQIAAKPGR